MNAPRRHSDYTCNTNDPDHTSSHVNSCHHNPSIYSLDTQRGRWYSRNCCLTTNCCSMNCCSTNCSANCCLTTKRARCAARHSRNYIHSNYVLDHTSSNALPNSKQLANTQCSKSSLAWCCSKNCSLNCCSAKNCSAKNCSLRSCSNLMCLNLSCLTKNCSANYCYPTNCVPNETKPPRNYTCNTYDPDHTSSHVRPFPDTLSKNLPDTLLQVPAAMDMNDYAIDTHSSHLMNSSDPMSSSDTSPNGGCLQRSSCGDHSHDMTPTAAVMDTNDYAIGRHSILPKSSFVLMSLLDRSPTSGCLMFRWYVSHTVHASSS